MFYIQASEESHISSTFIHHCVQDHQFLSERGFILFSYTENQVSSELCDVHLKGTYPAFPSFL